MADYPALDIATIAMALRMSTAELQTVQPRSVDGVVAEPDVVVGLGLMRAFSRIANPITKARVVALVEALAAAEEEYSRK